MLIPSSVPADLVVGGLRVDGRPSPALGVDAATPRLTWRLPAATGGATTVVVEAARTAAELSERRELLLSAEQPAEEASFRVPHGVLSPDVTLSWRVGLLDADRPEPRWSETATLETAPVGAAWSGSWISSAEWADPSPDFTGTPPVLGRDVLIDGDVARARLALSAPGSVEIHINGTIPGDEVLGFGYAVESTRIPARMLDVGDLLVPGRNTLRVTIAGGISWVPPTTDGRYTKLTTSALPPRLLARLTIEYSDGRVAEVVTDETWRSSEGPVRSSHWYGGEDIDGRLHEADGPIDETWNPAIVLGPASLHALWWARRPPLRIVDRIEGSVLSTDGDLTVIDFGVNVAGWPVIDLIGAQEGQRIEVRPAELIENGAIDQRTVGTPIWDSYTARAGDQTWHPRHVYHGFRYISVTGVDAAQFSAHAAVIRADNAPVGALSIDDPFLQTLHTIIDRAVQGNMYSVFTDCPSREKLGWIEQLHLCVGLLTRSYDVEAHLRDSLDLMRDAQHPGGLVPSIVPQTTDFSGNEWDGDPDAFVDDVNWGGAIAHLAWAHYLEYGDRSVLDENRDAVLRYLAHIEARSVDGLLDFGLGDWVALDTSTPASMVATAGWIHLLRTSAALLSTVGDSVGAAELEERAATVTARFIAGFRGPGAEQWGSGSQASLALALDLEVVPATEVDATVQRLLDAIETAGGHLTVGENSWPALLRVLHAHGRDDVIDRMIRIDDGPGYGLQIRLGATALAETWRGASGARYENSQNHFMLGMIHDWIAEDAIGLAQAADSVGWRTAVMRPGFAPAATKASFSQTTARGTFALEWDTDSGRITAEVPKGARALLVIPERWASDTSPALELEAGRWEWSA